MHIRSLLHDVPYVVLLLQLSVFRASAAEPSPAADIKTDQQSKVQQEQVLEKLEAEKTNIEESLQESTKQLKKTQQKIADSDSETEKTLLNELNDLQQFRKDLSKIKLQQTLAIEQRIDETKTKSQLLSIVENKLKQSPHNVDQQEFNEVIAIWRDVVDQSISSLFTHNELEVSDVPTSNLDRVKVSEKYNDLLAKIDGERVSAFKDIESLQQDTLNLFKTERELGSRLLLKAGRTRAAVMNSFLQKDQFSVWSVEPEQLQDYLREVQIVPYRFLAYFATKLVELRSISQNGVAGWVEIFKQIFLLLVVFALPFIIFKLFNMFSSYLEVVRKNLISRSQLNYKTRTKLALWIARINPYLPWIFAYFTIEFSETLLAGTLLEPLTVVTPYLQIYVSYRAFLIFFSAVLARTLLSRSLKSLRAKQEEIRKTSKHLSLLFFGEWFILHTTQDVVRRALIYNAVYGVIFYLNLLIVSLEAVHWKEELLSMSESWLNASVHRWLSNSSSRLLFYVICPLLFCGNILFLSASGVYRFFSRFEVGKKISSEIFKKRLEDATSEKDISNNTVSEDYQSLFKKNLQIDEDLRVPLSRAPLRYSLDVIEEWFKGKAHDDLLLLYGNYGIGKSSLMNLIEKQVKERIVVRKLIVQKKVTDEKELFALFTDIFDEPISSSDDLVTIDRKIGKTIIMIDDIHNLYLNIPSGLGAYKTLIELTNLQLKNIFWCFSINQRALSHLNGIFGIDHFMGKKVELLSWTDAEIQDLILKRHHKSGFRLFYDNVISAVHKGDILEASSDVEVQFFRLLWGQSRGNPLTAQELWLTSVSQVANQTIRITVPKFTNSKSISELSDDTLMVFSIIAKHENLSFDELVIASGMAHRTLLNSIKIGEDYSLLERVEPERRWRLHPKAQYVIQSQLSGRNYIYG